MDDIYPIRTPAAGLSWADTLFEQAKAHQEIFIAGVQAADENSPSARKLAALIQNIEEAVHCLAHTAAPKARGIKILRAAIAEAREARKP